jgi:hypothetical protein
MPKELLDGQGWYDWRVENWGTKWDISPNADIHRVSPTEAAFSFSSAWSPPTEAMQALADAGFSLDLFYIEEGVGFAGRFHADPDGSYDESGDVPDDLPEAVADHFAQTLETYETEEA